MPKITAARVIVTSPGRNFVTLKIETSDGVHGVLRRKRLLELAGLDEAQACADALVQAALSSRPWIQLSLAATIEEGLAALHDRVRSPLPQLILLDVHLPDASGLDFLKLAKANPETRHIPVVMISADATPEQVDACLAAGAACYLTKPVQILALLEQVDALLLQD